MQANNFIHDLIIDSRPYILTDEAKKAIQFEGIEKFIYTKLNSNKFKATKTTPDYDKVVRDKIHYCISNNLPIHLDLSTGATKNPRAVTAPGIDFAEVFNVAFIREFLKPIAAAYKYGVKLDYFSVAVFEEKVNHIPQQDVDLYDQQFSELITSYQKYLPDNLTINFSRLADRGSKAEMYAAMDKDIDQRRIQWPSLSEEVRTEKLRKAERNMYQPEKEQNPEESILYSALAHDSFSGECWSGIATPIWAEPDDISLGHRFTEGWAIHVRSAQGSTVNFWSGTGIIMQKGNKYIPTVLSPSQYKDVEKKLTQERVDFFKDNSVLKEKLSAVALYKA